MRCKACNKELNSFESTRRGFESGEYLDLCNDCFGTIAEDFNVTEREDLKHAEDEIVVDKLD